MNSMNSIVPLTNPLDEQLISMVLDSMPGKASRRVYANAIRRFLGWCRQEERPFNKATVQAFRASLQLQGLSASTINVHLSAIRKLSNEAADNDILDPNLAAGVSRVEGIPRRGVRTGNWLTLEEARVVFKMPNAATQKGVRDRALLGVLIGCGLRRQELVSLTTDHLALRDGRWVLVDLLGKGGRVRTVPVPGWVYEAVAAWLKLAGIRAGRIFRGLNNGVLGESLAVQAVYKIVEQYSKAAGVAVAPHDLRRSFARLSRAAGAPLEQVQFSLGHSSIKTTEAYVGCQQDLKNAPGDLIALG